MSNSKKRVPPKNVRVTEDGNGFYVIVAEPGQLPPFSSSSSGISTTPPGPVATMPSSGSRVAQPHGPIEQHASYQSSYNRTKRSSQGLSPGDLTVQKKDHTTILNSAQGKYNRIKNHITTLQLADAKGTMKAIENLIAEKSAPPGHVATMPSSGSRAAPTSDPIEQHASYKSSYIRTKRSSQGLSPGDLTVQKKDHTTILNSAQGKYNRIKNHITTLQLADAKGTMKAIENLIAEKSAPPAAVAAANNKWVEIEKKARKKFDKEIKDYPAERGNFTTDAYLAKLKEGYNQQSQSSTGATMLNNTGNITDNVIEGVMNAVRNGTQFRMGGRRSYKRSYKRSTYKRSTYKRSTYKRSTYKRKNSKNKRSIKKRIIKKRSTRKR